MTRVAYFDCPAGASGDMILGALVDAGLSVEALREGLLGLKIGGYSLQCRQVMKGDFRATKIDVQLCGNAADKHDRQHNGYLHCHPNDEHLHRRLDDVLSVIDSSTLPIPVKNMAKRIFKRLAEAEGRVHGSRPEQVYFHDVGAVDALVDITGACLGIHLMGIDAIYCSALPIGGGIVGGPHGRIPVPAPGTLELLRGVSISDNGIKQELLTPTGAAILTTLCDGIGFMPPMTLDTVGYGAGTIDIEIPNLLRIVIGEGMHAPETDSIMQIETTIDDMSPQLYEPLIEGLLKAGALDVYLTSVLMKKNRPGIVLTVLCERDKISCLADYLFKESTTIGVRWTVYQREILPREIVMLPTRYGTVPFKISRLAGRVITATPEFDDVRKLAHENNIAVREVLDEARSEGRRLLDQC